MPCFSAEVKATDVGMIVQLTAYAHLRADRTSFNGGLGGEFHRRVVTSRTMHSGKHCDGVIEHGCLVARRQTVTAICYRNGEAPLTARKCAVGSDESGERGRKAWHLPPLPFLSLCPFFSLGVHARVHTGRQVVCTCLQSHLGKATRRALHVTCGSARRWTVTTICGCGG